MDEPHTAIELSDVVQRFGRKAFGHEQRGAVLDHITLEIRKGSVTSLFGPSGCGKTALINLIMGITVPTSGAVTVLGEKAPFPTTRKQIGYMPQDDALYHDITAEENLRFFGGLSDLTEPALTQAVEKMLSFTQLDTERQKPVSRLSGGMRRRLSLGIALLHEPRLLVLDEPTVGLDPSYRKRIGERFCEMAQEGITILTTTNIMDEAFPCDAAILLHKGRILASGTPDDLLEQTQTDTLEEAYFTLAITSCEEGLRNA